MHVYINYVKTMFIKIQRKYNPPAIIVVNAGASSQVENVTVRIRPRLLSLKLFSLLPLQLLLQLLLLRLYNCVNYLCMLITEWQQNKPQRIVPLHAVIVFIKNVISVFLSVGFNQEAALYEELHPHEPICVFHLESDFSLHQRQRAVCRSRQWALLHTHCE